ncbi:M4 family metallopeptidase [Moellerella wisconsensis]|uniref:M4 family metallopeptidase n=1 Tax=Moellerella wisconsensis TaxID=158849 RepID=UPI001F4EE5C4|nr:M4 family metallopeptidase [Moellerella wisconsensis]UNH41446.1 M4 family metallopeptidase [Moellerella wisconsensis]
MNNTLGRTFVSPLLIKALNDEDECPNLASTLIHTNAVMNQSYDEDEIIEHRRAFYDDQTVLYNNYRIIRDAQQQVENKQHNHLSLPICRRYPSNPTLVPTTPHMAHEDFPVVLTEGEIKAQQPIAHFIYDKIGIISQFFAEKLNISDVLGCRSEVNAIIHYGKNYANAFWNGQAIFFGDGDGRRMGAFYNDIDIIAHELSHGFITSNANFTYLFQSGALNESVADVFGIMVKQYIQQQDVHQSNWLLGENLFLDRQRAPGLRSMSDPGSAFYFSASIKDDQVGHMNKYRYLSIYQDNGGVHSNSGIPNKAFYLLAKSLGGYSWERAGKIWLNALLDENANPSTDFRQFAKLTVKHASQLFGIEVAYETRKSWFDVGIDT